MDGNPCGECASCRAIAEGSSLNVIEIDAASNNGVDNIREIREEVSYSPTEGKYKVYIIDEAHMSYEKLGVTDFSDYISAYIAELIVRILAFIALFLLISLILRITFFTLDKAASLPGIRVANKLLGFLSGGILGLVVVWVFFLVITLFCTTSCPG